MAFFYNKRKDFSIQPPKQEVSTNPLFVTDSANIDFTLLTPSNLTADLTLTGVIAGTYGDATNVPQFTVDAYGRITGVTLVPISGGGGTYTVDNGLTENPANNFQLGGNLIQTTTVTGGSFSMIFTGARTTSFATMYINNTNTGLGLEVFAQNYIPLRVLTEPSSTNTIVETFVGRRRSTGLPANGIGQSWVFQNQVASSSIATSNELISEWTDVTPVTHTSRFKITGKSNGILQDLFTLNGDGSGILNKYGINTFAGTPTYALGVDASGNVIEFTPAGSNTVNRGFNIGNGNIVVAVGLASRALVVDFNCNVISWTFTSTNITGSMSIDIIRKNGAIPVYPTDSIVGAGVKPNLSSAKYAKSVPSGWTSTTLAAGDVLQIFINSNTLITAATLTLELQPI